MPLRGALRCRVAPSGAAAPAGSRLGGRARRVAVAQRRARRRDAGGAAARGVASRAHPRLGRASPAAVAASRGGEAATAERRSGAAPNGGVGGRVARAAAAAPLRPGAAGARRRVSEGRRARAGGRLRRSRSAAGRLRSRASAAARRMVVGALRGCRRWRRRRGRGADGAGATVSGAGVGVGREGGVGESPLARASSPHALAHARAHDHLVHTYHTHDVSKKARCRPSGHGVTWRGGGHNHMYFRQHHRRLAESDTPRSSTLTTPTRARERAARGRAAAAGPQPPALPVGRLSCRTAPLIPVRASSPT